LLVLVVGGALMGTNASIRELVKEREIYRRERAIGMSRWAYLASKVVVLSIITGLQAVALGLLGNAGRPAPDDPLFLRLPMAEIVVALAALTLASMLLGLLASAAISNEDRGMPLLVLLAMLQIMLSSALIQVPTVPGLAQLSWLVPARWGFALGASTMGLPSGPGAFSPYGEHDPLWDHLPNTWLLDLGALAATGLLFVAVTARLLHRLDPQRRSRRGAVR
jgi:ABC-type transport system involved in multi-copper enzyme maturation permease subunit